MKFISSSLLIALVTFSAGLYAQDVTTVQAKNSDISDNLDLEAVASVFMDAENLEEFERHLNDPEKKLSNLDLNEDGYVDYLRVIEAAEENVRVITIQAVVGKDLFQDVATIDVELDSDGNTQVQVVGDVFMYGNDYVIQPVYVQRPPIFVYLWRPRPVLWVSPFYWGYYPSYWSYWGPYPYNVYWSRVHVYRHYTFTYHSYHRSPVCTSLHRTVRRDDYAMRHPGKTFTQRTDGFRNKSEFDKNRGIEPAKPDSRAGRPVESDWQPNAVKEGRPSNVKDNKVSVPNSDRNVKGSSTTDQKPVENRPVKVDPKGSQKPTESAPVKVDPRGSQSPTESSPVKVDPRGTQKPAETSPVKVDPKKESQPRKSSSRSTDGARSSSTSSQERVSPSSQSSSTPKTSSSRASSKSSSTRSSSSSRSTKSSTPTKKSDSNSSSRGSRK